MRILVLISVSLILAVSSGLAKDAVEFTLTVAQTDHSGERFVLREDTAVVRPGIPAAGFLAPVSIELELLTMDTAVAEFLVHLVTLGPLSDARSRRFSVEYGLPARMSDLEIKEGASFELVVTPVGLTSATEVACDYNHREKGVFRFNPTAHTDLYFVPKSLADFHWNNIKGVFELRYREFSRLCQFNLPGKYSVYLCPCPIPSIIWDRQFGMATDPTRSTAFVIFSQTFNAVDPFVVNHPALLRNWGYAPALLCEGLAGYTSLPEFHAQRLYRDGELPPLADLMAPGGMRHGSAAVSDRAAGGLVKFLIGAYGMDRFRRVYEAAHDLNLETVINVEYSMTTPELEEAWHQYLDTVKIHPQVMMKQAELDEAMFHYESMHQLARAMVDNAETRVDSLRGLGLLKRACFYLGDYYGAVASQAAIVAKDSSSASQRTMLAAYRMMAGYHEQAREDLLAARKLDSTDQMAMFNLGLNYLISGDSAAAARQLNEMVMQPVSRGPGAEARVLLAGILQRSPDPEERNRARELDLEAVAMLNQSLAVEPGLPALHLWLGLASLHRGDLADAKEYFGAALFLETRPFYLALVNLSLGKLADIEGDRELAIAHYREVIGPYAAAYHQEEARRLIEQPYRR